MTVTGTASFGSVSGSGTLVECGCAGPTRDASISFLSRPADPLEAVLSTTAHRPSSACTWLRNAATAPPPRHQMVSTPHSRCPDRHRLGPNRTRRPEARRWPGRGIQSTHDDRPRFGSESGSIGTSVAPPATDPPATAGKHNCRMPFPAAQFSAVAAQSPRRTPCFRSVAPPPAADVEASAAGDF